LDKLNELQASEQKLYAHFFVRWLRTNLRENVKEAP